MRLGLRARALTRPGRARHLLALDNGQVGRGLVLAGGQTCSRSVESCPHSASDSSPMPSGTRSDVPTLDPFAGRVIDTRMALHVCSSVPPSPSLRLGEAGGSRIVVRRRRTRTPAGKREHRIERSSSEPTDLETDRPTAVAVQPPAQGPGGNPLHWQEGRDAVW